MHPPTLLLLALTGATTAQFGFFEHMFGGQEHRQPQNVPSDSAAYRQNYDGCAYNGLCLSFFVPPTSERVRFFC